MQDNYFYVVYDIYDDVKFICNNRNELSSLTGFRIDTINYRFKISKNKGKNFITTIIDDRYYKIYRYLNGEF